MIGEQIGNYRILSLLGAGGMGEVYLAEHTAIETKVAIKLLQPQISKDDEQVQRFFNEARAVSRVRHAGTVKISDVGHHTSKAGHRQAYLVMEFLDGESLAARIRRLGRLPGDQVADIGRQIAGVLDAVHAAGITHRDLKPDNVFLVPDAELPSGERVKVLDFGIAKLTGTLSGHSPQTRGTMGTPAYMAPEQWNNAASVDSRADTYSLGCLMFEMATGKTPFPAGSIGEACTHHLHTPPPRLAPVVPAIPPEVDALVDRMLAKAPEQRPTLKEVARTFTDVVASGASARWTAAASGQLAATMPPTPTPVAITPPPFPRAPTPSPGASTPIPVSHTPGLANPLVRDSAPMPVAPTLPTPQHPPHPTTMPRGEALPPAMTPVAAKPKRTALYVASGAAVALGGTIAAITLAGGADEPRPEPKPVVESPPDRGAITGGPVERAPEPQITKPPEKTPRELLLEKNAFVDAFGVRVLAHQVTRAEYQLVMGREPPGPPTRNAEAPVAWLMQSEAAELCARIDGRLPTSDEWARAADGEWMIGANANAWDRQQALQEWTSTIQDELAVVRGGHGKMSGDALAKAARQKPPYFLQKETGDPGDDRKAVAGATIGFRCVDGTEPPVAEKPAPAPVKAKPRTGAASGGGSTGGMVGLAENPFAGPGDGPATNPKVPTVNTGPSQIVGSLPAEVIRRVLRRSISQIRFCYEKELSKRPDLEGKVVVRFVIGTTGQVVRAEASGMPGVDDCIAAAVRRLVFPAPDGGGVVSVSFPFIFKPSR